MRTYTHFEQPREQCNHCGSQIEDHGDVCRICGYPRETHEVHDMGHPYDEVRFRACPGLPYHKDNEFAEAVRP